MRYLSEIDATVGSLVGFYSEAVGPAVSSDGHVCPSAAISTHVDAVVPHMAAIITMAHFPLLQYGFVRFADFQKFGHGPFLVSRIFVRVPEQGQFLVGFLHFSESRVSTYSQGCVVFLDIVHFS